MILSNFDHYQLLIKFTTSQVRGVRPLPLMEMSNLFNSYRLMVCPGLVSSSSCLIWASFFRFILVESLTSVSLSQDPNPNNMVASTTFYSETTRAMLCLVIAKYLSYYLSKALLTKILQIFLMSDYQFRYFEMIVFYSNFASPLLNNFLLDLNLKSRLWIGWRLNSLYYQCIFQIRIETDPADRTQLRMTVASGDPTLTFE